MSLDSDTLNSFVTAVKAGVTTLVVAGTAVYGTMLIIYVVKWLPGHEYVKAMLDPKAAYTFGLPISGFCAFAIVTVLNQIVPSKPGGDGSLAFQAFGLAFSGPAGPITLWLVCYLTLVLSMRLVRPKS